MSAVNVPFRLLPKDLCAGNAMPFQEQHEARVDRHIDNIDLNEFFQGVQPNIQVGDKVTICAYQGGTDTPDRQLVQVRECRIVSKRQEVPGGPSRVRAVWTGDLCEIDQQARGAPAKAIEQKLTVKKEFRGGFTVQDEKGNVVVNVNTKKEAEDYIDRLNPKPAEKVAVAA